MCLDTIKEKNDIPSTMIMSGWKQFNGSGRSLRFQNMPINSNYDVPLDEWIKAEKKTVSGNGFSYESGFHVYTEEKELNKQYSYRHVYIRKIKTVGIQSSMTVAVAEEMYVPSDPDDWPPKPGEPTPPKKESLIDRAKKHLKPGNA